MKYVDIIQYLISPKQLDDLYERIGAAKDSEALLIYMKGALDLESEIYIFEKDGCQYYQLFPVGHAVELIENDLDLKNKGYSATEVAQRLLDYRLNDA